MRFLGALGLATLAFHGPAAAQDGADQQACMGDAFAFCAAQIPDHDLVRRCLLAQRARISEACRQRLDGADRPGRRRRE